MNRFNSLGCCWDLKPLENPIFQTKISWEQENSKTVGSVLVLLRTGSTGSSRNNPSSCLGGSVVTLLVQSQQKKCPPHWSYPVQKVLQPCFPALGKCQLLVVAPISKPCCLLSQENARRLCVGGKGTHGKAWLFLPFCQSALMHLSLQQLLWVLWLQGSEQTLQSLSKASLSVV